MPQMPVTSPARQSLALLNPVVKAADALRASPLTVLWLIGLLGVWQGFWSDMIFPALVAMKDDLQVPAAAVQQVVSLLFLANAFMCLVHGILIDAWGRRRVALAALGVLLVTSVLCALATRIEQLWALRLMQGAVVGLGHILCRAIIRDLYSGVQAQHMIGRTSMLQSAAPLVLPLLAGWITLWAGWRGVFWVLAATAFLALVIYARWLPETLPRERCRAIRLASLWQGYRRVALSAAFLRPSTAHALNWSALFLYVVAGPALLTRWMGRAPTDMYLIFTPIMLGLMLGLYLLPRCSHWLGGRDPLPACYVFLMATQGLNLVLVLVGVSGLALLFPMGLCAVGVGLCMPVLVARALQPFADQAGLAASLQMFGQYALMALTAAVLAPLFWNSLTALAWVSAALSALGFALVWRTRSVGWMPAPPAAEGAE